MAAITRLLGVFCAHLPSRKRGHLALAVTEAKVAIPAGTTSYSPGARRGAVDQVSRIVLRIFLTYRLVCLGVGRGVGDLDDPVSHQLVNQAILVLERSGPAEGRPLVDTVTASRIANMKELRPPSAGRSEVRILLVFDPWRSAVLLVAGDKSGQWAK